MFLLLGNVSGNAIAFGTYTMTAAGYDPNNPNRQYEKGGIIGLAVMALSICTAFHLILRQRWIHISNVFALFKLGILLTIAILGLSKGARPLRKTFYGVLDPENVGNLSPINGTSIAHAFESNLQSTPFSRILPTGDIGSFANSFMLVLFAFDGFEQAFYVLSEMQRPRKILARSIFGTLSVIMALYILVNIAYLCVIPKDMYLQNPSTTSVDMASTFFHILFDSSLTPSNASRFAAGITACSAFGNILVMTRTISRVKQEIAKECILPFRSFFSSIVDVPWARWHHRFRLKHSSGFSIDINGVKQEEQGRISALLLHYITSLLPLAIVSWLKKPSQMYELLVLLHSYTNVAIIGLLVSSGLIYLKIDAWFNTGRSSRHWNEKVAWKPYLDPLPQVIFFLASVFLMFATFLPAKEGSPFSSRYLGYQTWSAPLAGLTALVLGVVWWLGLRGVEFYRRQRLTVRRVPYLVKDEDGSYVQRAEIVTHEWLLSSWAGSLALLDDEFS
jgi:amino acid transporter